MAEIQYIAVAKLWPHPDNPRKDVGDVTELAESIKANGVLQNLTVVPRLGGITGKPTGSYTVIIGHRRLAAAKAAGLKTVPCVITEMTLQEQVGTMLLENMQRSDLTVYEQAQGFQMMIDLGETVETVAQKTGFSQATVRRRVRLLDLDAEKFKASESRGATLQDYMELDKIKDPELRNSVLDTIGTPNFQNKLRGAMEEETRKAFLAEVARKMETFAARLPDDAQVDHGTMYYQRNYSWWDRKKEVQIPEDAESAKYFFRVGTYQVDLYKEKLPTDTTAAQEAEAQRERVAQIHQARYAEAKEIRQRHFELRKAFIMGFTRAKSCLSAIISAACIATVTSIYDCTDDDLLAELLEEPILAEDDDLDEALFAKAVAKNPEYALLAITYALMEDRGAGYFRLRWDADAKCQLFIYQVSDRLDGLYKFLTSIGYEMSDEEKALQNGTHELFREVAEEESEAAEA